MLVDDLRQWLAPCALRSDAPRYTVIVRRDQKGRVGIWHQYTERDHKEHRIASVVVFSLFLVVGGLFAFTILPHELGAERGRRVAFASVLIATAVLGLLLTVLWNYKPAIAKGRWLARLDLANRTIEFSDGSTVPYTEIRELRSRTYKDIGSEPIDFTQHQLAARVNNEWRWFGLFSTYRRSQELCKEFASQIGVPMTSDWIQPAPKASSSLWCDCLKLDCDRVPYADRWIAADEF